MLASCSSRLRAPLSHPSSLAGQHPGPRRHAASHKERRQQGCELGSGTAALPGTAISPCMGTQGPFCLGALNHVTTTLVSPLFLSADLSPASLPMPWTWLRAPRLFFSAVCCPLPWLPAFSPGFLVPTCDPETLVVILSFLPVTAPCSCSIFHEKV